MNLKQGTSRFDGKIFWAMVRNKEYWVTPEQFIKNQESHKRAKNKFKVINKDKMLTTARIWYSKNVDHIRKTKKISAKNNRATKKGHIRAIFNSRKSSAIANGVPFKITLSYAIDIANDYCPVLNTKLNWGIATGKTTANSPSLDKFNANLGYIVGNVYWISHKANAMKQNATLKEVESLYLWMKHIQSTPAK